MQGAHYMLSHTSLASCGLFHIVQLYTFHRWQMFLMHALPWQVLCNVKEEALDLEVRAPEIVLPLSVRMEKKQVIICAPLCTCNTGPFRWVSRCRCHEGHTMLYRGGREHRGPFYNPASACTASKRLWSRTEIRHTIAEGQEGSG